MNQHVWFQGLMLSALLCSCTCGDGSGDGPSSEAEGTESGESTDTGGTECEALPSETSDRVVWTKEFDQVDELVSTDNLLALSDGSLLVVGRATPGGHQTFAASHTADGDEEWSWTRDLLPGGDENSWRTAAVGPSGGFAIGLDGVGMWVGEFSSEGDEEWSVSVQAPPGTPPPGWVGSSSMLERIAYDADGALLVLGVTDYEPENPDEEDEQIFHAWLLRIPPGGGDQEIVWSKEGAGSREASLYVTESAIFVADFVDVGLFTATDTRIWKLTYDGAEQWARTYDLAPDERPALGQGDDSRVLVVGGRAEDGDLELTEEDALVAIVDTNSGEVQWNRSFGYCGRDNILARSFTVQGDVIILQSVKQNPKDSLDWKGVVRRIDADGETVWTGLAPHPERGWDRHLAVMDGAVIVGGVTADQPRKYVLTKMAL